MRRRLILAVLAILGATPLASPAAAALPQSHAVAGIPTAEIDAFARQYAEKHLGPHTSPALFVALVDKAGNRYTAAFGQSSLNGRRASPDQPMRVGSQTKLFTAVGILTLVEQGRIRLDAPVETYLGGYKLPRAPGLSGTPAPTIRDLLRHSSGLSNIKMVHSGFHRGEPHPPLADMIPQSGPILERRPGVAMSYTNADYTLLGRVIEVVTGEPYEQYIQQLLLGPLGMKSSSLILDDAMRARIVQGVLLGGARPVPFLIDSTFTRPSGDLMASADDMGNFMQMWLNRGTFEGRQIIPPGVIDKLMSDCFAGPPLMAGWCLGPARELRSGLTGYSHSGDHLSYITQLVVIPSRGLAVWAGNNSDGLTSLEFVDAFLSHVYPEWAPRNLAPAHAAPGLTRSVAGTYMRNAVSMARSGKFFELLQPGAQFTVKADGADAILLRGAHYHAVGPYAFQADDPKITREGIATFDKADQPARLIYFDQSSAARIPFWKTIPFNVAVIFLGLCLVIVPTLVQLIRGPRAPGVYLALSAGVLWIGGLAAMVVGLSMGDSALLTYSWPPLFLAGSVMLCVAMVFSLFQLGFTAKAVSSNGRGGALSSVASVGLVALAVLALYWQFVPFFN